MAAVGRIAGLAQRPRRASRRLARRVPLLRGGQQRRCRRFAGRRGRAPSPPCRRGRRRSPGRRSGCRCRASREASSSAGSRKPRSWSRSSPTWAMNRSGAGCALTSQRTPTSASASSAAGVGRVEPRGRLQQRGGERGRLGEVQRVAGVHPAAGDLDPLAGVRRGVGVDDRVVEVRRPVDRRGLVAVAVGGEEAEDRRAALGRRRRPSIRPRLASAGLPDHDPVGAGVCDRAQVGGVGVAPRVGLARALAAGARAAPRSPSASTTRKRWPRRLRSLPTIATFASPGALGPPTRIVSGGGVGGDRRRRQRGERRDDRERSGSGSVAGAHRWVAASVRGRPRFSNTESSAESRPTASAPVSTAASPRLETSTRGG